MKFFFLGLVFLSFSSWADPTDLTADFKKLLKSNSLGTSTNHSYCYQNEEGVAEGFQPDKLQKIASVTKLLTTFFASETLDLKKKFETKIYISGDRLHIQGSRDPYFEEEKLMLLMQALNNLGYKSFKKVTFNKDFIFYDLSLNSYEEITPAKSLARLKLFFNSKNVSFLKSNWTSIANFAQEEGVTLDKKVVPDLNVTSVSLSETNPLVNENPIIYVHKSRPLHAILKSMNVVSRNLVAQNVYLEAGRIKRFDTLLTEYGISRSTYKIYNGSGLPIKSANSRTDNWSTCSTLIKVIALLEKSLMNRHKLYLSDVVAVSGRQDLGSFRTRFEDFPETDNAVISKTGTVNGVSTLAGVLMLDGSVPFAILNQSSASLSRQFQDQFVAQMFHHLGTPTPIVYEKISIFPWDETDFLSDI